MGNVRFDRCFRGNAPIGRKYLMRQICDGLRVPGIAQQHDVMRIQTDRLMIFGFIEQILTDVDGRQIAMVRDLRKYVDHKRIDRIHEIVEYQHGRLSSVENVLPWIRKSLVKAHERSISFENRLAFDYSL